MTQRTPHDRRLAALTSPLRLEIVGLFTESDPLSIADMAARTGRPATSLYHHVNVLTEAGVLMKAGTRPKGKRFETLYRPCETTMALEVEPDDDDALECARQAHGAALRMAERDFTAALERPDLATDGPLRNLMSARIHMRASADLIADLNSHLDALMTLLQQHAAADDEPGPDDRFLSLTLTLAPLRGRRADDDRGDDS